MKKNFLNRARSFQVYFYHLIKSSPWLFIISIACLILILDEIIENNLFIAGDNGLIYFKAPFVLSHTFDYNKLGKGVKPVHHFQNMESISSTVFQLKGQSGIYLWFNRVTGDIYVGSAIDLKIRLYRYGLPSYLASTKTSMIINSLNKYPLYCWDLIILENVSGEELIVRETYWINHINTTLNILREAANSPLGIKRSLETKIKMSESKKGDKHPLFGIGHTEETKARISATQSVKKQKLTYKFDKEGGTLLATYNSLNEAAIANNINTKTLSWNLLRGRSVKEAFYTYNKDGSTSKKE